MPLVPSMKEMNAGVIGAPSANEMSTGVNFGVPNANEMSIGVRSQLLLPKRHKRSDELPFFISLYFFHETHKRNRFFLYYQKYKTHTLGIYLIKL